MADQLIRPLMAEPVHPEHLSIDNFLALEAHYQQSENMALFERRPADAIAASGARQAITGLITAVWGPPTETEEVGS